MSVAYGRPSEYFCVIDLLLEQEEPSGWVFMAGAPSLRKRLVNTSSILMRASRGLTVISHWPTRNP